MFLSIFSTCSTCLVCSINSLRAIISFHHSHLLLFLPPLNKSCTVSPQQFIHSCFPWWVQSSIFQIQALHLQHTLNNLPHLSMKHKLLFLYYSLCCIILPITQRRLCNVSADKCINASAQMANFAKRRERDAPRIYWMREIVQGMF